MDECEEEVLGFETKDETGQLILIKDVMDSYGTVHSLTKPFPPGGQGIVFKTTNPNIVVKFLLGKHNKNNPMEEGFVITREKSEGLFKENDKLIQKIIEKPLPKNIHIAIPMAKLNDYSGYVMLLMKKMDNFKDIINGIKSKEVGGLRRKYDLLAKLSIILAQLHSLGMVYCDISEGNVYATKNVKSENQNVWLIDPDNIYIPNIDVGGWAYTQKYAAPEIIKNQTLANANSDVYAFATLAFESIFSLLPFAGRKTTDWYGTNDESADDWDATKKNEKDEKEVTQIDPRFSGKYPWILDPIDASNRVESLTLDDAQLFLTDSVYSLFNQTFTDGRLEPEDRPPIFLWPKYLFEAKDKVICCTNSACRSSFIYEENMKECPYCKKNLPKILNIYKGDKLIFSHELDFESLENFYLPKRIFYPFDDLTGNESFIEVIPKKLSGLGLEFHLLTQNINEKILLREENPAIEKYLVNRLTIELFSNNKYVINYVDTIKKTNIDLVIKVEGEE